MFLTGSIHFDSYVNPLSSPVDHLYLYLYAADDSPLTPPGWYTNPLPIINMSSGLGTKMAA
mgnify:CR=1 FL=1